MRGAAVVVVLLAACGDNRLLGADGPSSADGRRGDATVDAEPDAELAGLATVTLHRHFGEYFDVVPGQYEPVTGQPIPDVHVSFVWPDGTAFERITDSAGQASALVVPGSSVTVITFYSFTSSWNIRTYVDVNPGDHIIRGAEQAPPTGSITMNIAFDPVPFATGYVIGACADAWGGSGSGSGGVGSFEVAGYCLEHPFDIGLYHEPPGSPDVNGDGWLDAYVAVAHDVVATPGGTVQLSAWELWDGHPFHIEGVVPPFYVRLEQATLGNVYNAVFLEPPHPYPSPATFYDGRIMDSPIGDTLVQVAQNPWIDVHWYRLDPTQPSESIDVAPDRLPTISTVSFDLPTRTVTWTETGPGGDRVDLMSAVLRIVRGGETWSWSVIAPPSAITAIEFPNLGPTYQHMMPIASDTVTAFASIHDYGAFGWQSYKSTPDNHTLFSPGSTLQASHHSHGSSSP